MNKRYNIHQYECDGPYLFGPDINKVCCHGWNTPHFLTSEEVDRTQQLINCGVIHHADTLHIQVVAKVARGGDNG